MRANPTGWMVAAILLFIGANLLVDPESFTAVGQNFTAGIRNFELRSRGIFLREMRLHSRRSRSLWPLRGDGRNRGLSKTAARLSGLTLIAFGLLLAAVS